MARTGRKEMIIQFAKVIAGGLISLFYYKFIGCNQGCSITGSPLNSMVYGAMLGLVWGWPTKKNRRKISEL